MSLYKPQDARLQQLHKLSDGRFFQLLWCGQQHRHTGSTSCAWQGVPVFVQGTDLGLGDPKAHRLFPKALDLGHQRHHNQHGSAPSLRRRPHRKALVPPGRGHEETRGWVAVLGGQELQAGLLLGVQDMLGGHGTVCRFSCFLEIGMGGVLNYRA